MSFPTPDLDHAASLIDHAQELLDHATDQLIARGGIDAQQTFAYDLAHASSAIATARFSLPYARKGPVEANLFAAFLANALTDMANRALGREHLFGFASDWFAPFTGFVSAFREAAFVASLANTPGSPHYEEEFQMVADTFHRFAEEQVRPHAEHIHRTNGDIPDAIINSLAEVGGF